MKLKKTGTTTSAVEIQNISPFGIWLLANKCEYFLDYRFFPFFKNLPISEIFNVIQPHMGHLYWPTIDVDLSLEVIAQPEKFPKVSRIPTGVKKSRKVG